GSRCCLLRESCALLSRGCCREHGRAGRLRFTWRRVKRGSKTTEFRIFGAGEARAEDRPLTLGGPKQRALLALLLLRTGEVVSREALVDALWGAEPPRSAVQSLQVYVHGLRQALGGGRIETVGSGYRLPLDDGELDLVRFERLLDQGGRALAAGRPADAADGPRGALAPLCGRA